MTYYPLTIGNSWTYANADGSTFTNAVTGGDGVNFTMQSTAQPQPQGIRRDGDNVLTDSYQAGNWQVLVKEALTPGDSWDIAYQANGIDTVLKMTVKAVGVSLDVAGKTFTDVAVIEGDMKMSMNGTPVPMTYVVQYHYAQSVGLVLTTGSQGERMPLISYELK